MFFDDANVVRLMDIILRLSGEVSVLYERLDTMEQLLASAGVLSAVAVEEYRPDEAVSTRRADWRLRFLRRVFRIVADEREALANGETEDAYRALHAAVSAPE
jgi:xanthine/CO dehydrogenase XdhC/CoxF family maturation factor